MSSTQIIAIMHHLHIVGHWCIKLGFTTNRSCDAFTIPATVHGTPFYLAIEERDKVYYADLSNETPSTQVYCNIFMFHCLIGCRVGDLEKMTEANMRHSDKPHRTKDVHRQLVQESERSEPCRFSFCPYGRKPSLCSI